MEFETEGLPDGWIKTNLENCLNILDNKRVPINSNERSKRYGSIPYYGATGQIGWIDDYLFNETLVLLGEDGAPFLETFKDKAYIISGKSWVNNHAHVLQVMPNILLNKFLMYFLNQFNYKDYVTGTTRLKLNQTRMKDIPILFPPLPEQHRIVSKIESIFGRIDACREKLERVARQTKSASGSLSQLKSSILKQAFEGKLVPQDPNDEPAEVLLKRLHVDSDKLEFETDGLPEGWIRTKMSDLVLNPKEDIVDGPFGSNLKATEYVKTGVPLIRLQNVNRNQFVNKNIKYVTQNKAMSLKRHNFKTNDIIITKLGKPLGESCMVPPYLPNGIIVADIVRIRISHGLISKQFLVHVINSDQLVRQFEKYTKGTTRSRVNLTKIRNFQIPIPPLPEQHRIVSKIESIFGKIDAKMELIKVRVLFTCLVHIIR